MYSSERPSSPPHSLHSHSSSSEPSSYSELFLCSAANANLGGTLRFLLRRLCPSSGVLTNSNCIHCSFISLSAGLKKDPCLPPRAFIGCLSVLWCVNLVIPPLVLTPLLLHSLLSIFPLPHCLSRSCPTFLRRA